MDIVRFAPVAIEPVFEVTLPDKDVIGDYRFWVGGRILSTKLQDYSLYGSDGTITGAFWQTNDTVSYGRKGYALDFDGVNDSVDVAGLLNNVDATLGSIVVWFKVLSAGVWGLSTNRVLFQFRETASPSDAITMYLTNTADYRVRYRGGGVTKDIDYDISGRTDTDWHMAAATYSAADDMVYSYFDGAQVGSIGSLGSIDSSVLDTAKIGSRFSGDLSWNGLIDEVKIYNKVLTATEIKYLYETGKQG